jgi:hypothetical protein
MSLKRRLAPRSPTSRNMTSLWLSSRMGAGYRRARLSALAGGAFGSVVGFGAVLPSIGGRFDAASSLANAARRGSKRGAWGKRSSSMTPRIAAVTAASSSAGRSIVGTARIWADDICPARSWATRPRAA